MTEKVLFDEDVHTSGYENVMKLPFDDESVDIVTSSLSLHWVNNLPGCHSFVKCTKYILQNTKPDIYKTIYLYML